MSNLRSMLCVFLLALLVGACGDTRRTDGDAAKGAATVEDVLELDQDDADRAEAKRLLKRARSALAKHRYKDAKRLAAKSRRLHATAAAAKVRRSANAAIARSKAAARERRQAAAAVATPTPEPAKPDCDPNYAGACLDPSSSDYDCAGGSGDGPDYTGPVRVVGSDPHGLDRDGDGFACEG